MNPKMNLLSKWLSDRRLRKLIGDRTFLNLGAGEAPWPGFVTCGLAFRTVEVIHDATKAYPAPMRGRFEFVWSERMLEHIACNELPAVFAELKTILRPDARARFCLPICFFGTQKINMVRAGNAERCKEYGHVSWFTHEGVGEVTDEVFGCESPPNQWKSWDELLGPIGLSYVPVRHFDAQGALFVDDSVLSEGSTTPFADRPEVLVRRPDSLIFDIVIANP